MLNPLKIAPPPPRRTAVEADPPPAERPEPNPRAPEHAPQALAETAASKFRQVKEVEMVQFNKRVRRGVADGYEMLAIRSRKKVPELLAEGLELLEQRYGKV